MRAAVPSSSRDPPALDEIVPLPLVYGYAVAEEPVSPLIAAVVTVRKEEDWQEGERRGGKERKGGRREEKPV